MKKFKLVRIGMTFVILAAFLPLLGCAPKEKPKVTFFWAIYDGLTEDFRATVESAFNKASTDAQVQIVPV